MSENDLRDLLPGERSLPPSRRRDMQERLMVQIQQEEKATRNHFRLLMGVAAAVLIAVIGTAAVLAGTNEEDSKPPVMSPASVDRSFPDPDEVSRAMQGSGVDYGINAERLDCFTLDAPADWSSEGDVGWLTTWVDSTVGTEPSIGSAPVTADLMASTCLEIYGNYVNITGATVVTEVCVRDGVRPQMVVALGEDDCETAAEANPGGPTDIRPITDEDVAELNFMRAVEFALLAPMEECPTAAQVEEWVYQVLEEEGLQLEVVVDNSPIIEPGDTEPTPQPPCPRFAHVDWQTGVVIIQPFTA